MADNFILIQPAIKITSEDKTVELKTAGKYVDKNIRIPIEAPGKASDLPSGDIVPGAVDQTFIIEPGYTPGGTFIVKAASEGTAGELTNAAKEGINYTDISNDAPVLISGDYLYISPGYFSGSKVSLAQLVPDGASDVAAIKAGMLNNVTAYDNNGQLVTGDISTYSPSNVEILNDGGVVTVVIPGGYYPVIDGQPQSKELTLDAGSVECDDVEVNVEVPLALGNVHEKEGNKVVTLSGEQTIATKGSVAITEGYIQADEDEFDVSGKATCSFDIFAYDGEFEIL